MFEIAALPTPVVAAPMAGGPSTPALAAAVSAAGGLGMLAGAARPAADIVAEVEAARALGAERLGVNLFVPSPPAAGDDEVQDYRRLVAERAERLGLDVGDEERAPDEAAAFREAVDAVAGLRPALVSFTFGVPDAGVLERLRAAGVLTAVSVTTAAEGELAVAAGAGSLVLQGPDAGGHRATLDPAAAPSTIPLAAALRALRLAVDVPVVVAGGIADRVRADTMLEQGAVAVQLGTALLLADEAGTPAVHRAALSDDRFPHTAFTRAFSGRWARGLVNDFSRDLAGEAPAAYPAVDRITRPLRAAAAAAGDAQNVSLWAGTGVAEAREAPAAEIVRGIAG